jgi:putative spermidine/putrescine transport system substrate-binding protein
MEYLYSDEGQITWMKGYCTPIRYDDLKKRNVIPADVAAKLPDTTGVQLPTLDQINKASDLITKGWASSVGATVK